MPTVTPLKTDMIVEGFGVTTHFAQPENIYMQLKNAVIAAMADLGIRYYRDNMLYKPETRDLANQLFAYHGMKNVAVCVIGSAEQNWADLQLMGHSCVAAIEGRNEPAGAAAVEAGNHIRALSALVKGSTILDWKRIPILSPSVLTAANFAALGNISAAVSRYNVHPYPGAYRGEKYLNGFTEGNYVPPADTGIMWATETGYHTKTDEYGFEGVPDNVAAIYLPRLLVTLLTHPTHRFEKVFPYEMLCSCTPNLALREQTFGFLHQDGTKRPQYHAMKALLNTFKDRRAVFTVKDIECAMSGKNPTVLHRVFQKSDGAYYILVWNNKAVWDPAKRQPIVVPELSETIRTNIMAGTAAILRINDPAPEWSSAGMTSGQVTLPVSTGISIVRIHPT